LYMLASDGLMREVDDRRIAEILTAAGALEEACAQLIEAANQAGGQDNITCVLARRAEAFSLWCKGRKGTGRT
jgi:PPM family protein phosphatase